MPFELARGMRDFPPNAAIMSKSIAEKVEAVFKRFGFYPLKTPALEKRETLLAKTYGDDAEKEIFFLDNSDLGLRYDMTVPLARYVSSDKSLQMPFKRYQIGDIWRRDEPQHMRYREFTQADVDIVGCGAPAGDAEVIAATALALEEAGVGAYEVRMNDRKMLGGLLDYFSIPEKDHSQAIRIIDKKAKIGGAAVADGIAGLGVERGKAESIVAFLEGNGEGGSTLEKVYAMLPGLKDEIKTFSDIMELVASYGIAGQLRFDPSLARGLDYYTGAVWEFIAIKDGIALPSLGGGGRYDKLIGSYSGRDIPAVGSSIGIDRVVSMLGLEAREKTYAKVIVIPVTKDEFRYALGIANRLRAAGICTDLAIIERSISKNLEYANGMGISNGLIIGKKEIELNKVKLRNMSSGTEELLDLQDAIRKLGGG
jgi:histidyl-tRNA synthetase